MVENIMDEAYVNGRRSVAIRKPDETLYTYTMPLIAWRLRLPCDHFSRIISGGAR